MVNTSVLEYNILKEHDDIPKILTRRVPSLYKDDAISELRLNMLIKLRRFNPNRSKSLRSYLWKESKFHVKYVSQKYSLVKTPIRDHSLRNKIIEYYEKQRKNDGVNLKQIAHSLKTPFKTVERVVNAHRSKGEMRNRVNMIIENIFDTTEQNLDLETQESFESLYNLLRSIEKFDRICICLYFGIDGVKLSKDAISRVLGVPRQDIDKAIKRALKYLRRNKDQIIPL